MSTTANPAQFFIVPSPFFGGSPWYAVNRSGATVMLIAVTDTYLTNTGIQRTSANDFWQRLIDLYQGGQGLAGGS